ncbi:hypothetical protein BEN71_00310 (plasmid) [Acinetobacter wuhouensis]|nr:hypothetical protein BEN71_00310 [Acinetobacter wuhouensis]
MFITSFEEQNITYRSCSNLRIHLYILVLLLSDRRSSKSSNISSAESISTLCPDEYFQYLTVSSNSMSSKLRDTPSSSNIPVCLRT